MTTTRQRRDRRKDRRCRTDKSGARRLYRRMGDRGWSEYQLSLESGVAYNTIRAIIDHGRCPSLRVQGQIAEAFGPEVKAPDIWRTPPLVMQPVAA